MIWKTYLSTYPINKLKELKTQFTNTSEGMEFQSELEHLLEMVKKKVKIAKLGEKNIKIHKGQI